MAFEKWMNRVWRVHSHNGDTSGVTSDCRLVFQEEASLRTGRCSVGHECPWLSPVVVDYVGKHDRGVVEMTVNGKLRTYLLYRYLPTSTAVRPALIAREKPSGTDRPDPNEEVGKWTAEEGEGLG